VKHRVTLLVLALLGVAVWAVPVRAFAAGPGPVDPGAAAGVPAPGAASPSARPVQVAQNSSPADAAGAGPAGPAAAPPTAPASETAGPTINFGASPYQDKPQGSAVTSKDDYKSPFLKSVLTFDQSTSAETLGVGGTPQSYIPFYEWWISFRPRYYFTNKLFVSGRFDYYKEFTNTDQGRTLYREDVFGDIWTNLVYETPVPVISKNTKVSAGLRALWPTSKPSQDAGIYVNLGATAGIKQTIPIRGESANFLSDAHVGLSGWYSHNFSQATTPINPSFQYIRQDTDGNSILSDQLSGSMLVNHQLLTGIDTGLSITDKLALTVDFLFIQQWKYSPPGGVSTSTTGQSLYTPPSNAPNYVLETWFITNVDYQLFEELTLALGYMNLQNSLSYQGENRTLFGSDNVFWSPDARFFFDITANLDRLWDRASGRVAAASKVTDVRAEGR
jgi:hypothetical protein